MQFVWMRRASAALIVLITVTTGARTAEAAETKRYSVISGGEKVGSLEAVVDGEVTTIDYMVRNNGRGPTLTERIGTDASGNVVNWAIEGESTFGSAIDEEYVWADGAARWKSQSGSGETAADAPPVYIANDASPWEVGVYARAALASEDRRIDVLPGGTLKVDLLGEMQLGEGQAAMPVRIIALSGLGLRPNFVLIDEDGDLASTLGANSVTVREGFEDAFEELTALSSTLTEQRVEALQEELAHRFAGPVYYRNVRIFDPEAGETSRPATVVVYKTKIAAVDYENRKIAEGAEGTVIDGEGGVLVPGLHDMHSHTGMWSGLFYLAAGVTATRDQGNNNEELLGILEKMDAGKIAGPRVVKNGMIEGRSEHSVRASVIADTLEEGLEAVRWYADHGYFQIKIYNSMNPKWVKPLADEAKRLGLGVTGHIPAFMKPDEAILAGYDDIAHINQLMLGWLLEKDEDTRTPLRLTGMARAADLDLGSEKVRRTVALMKEHGVAQDTTAMILERLMLSRAGEVAEGDAPYLDHMPIGYQRYRKRSFVSLDEPGADERYRKAFETLLDVLAMLHEEGIQLLPGTDDSTGVSVHREIELYVKAGLSNADALRLATLACEKYFGADQSYGSIEKGKYADFFLIADDPLQDISAIRKARLVSRAGVVYFPGEIYEALSIRPFATPPSVRPL